MMSINELKNILAENSSFISKYNKSIKDSEFNNIKTRNIIIDTANIKQFDNKRENINKIMGQSIYLNSIRYNRIPASLIYQINTETFESIERTVKDIGNDSFVYTESYNSYNTLSEDGVDNNRLYSQHSHNLYSIIKEGKVIYHSDGKTNYELFFNVANHNYSLLDGSNFSRHGSSYLWVKDIDDLISHKHYNAKVEYKRETGSVYRIYVDLDDINASFTFIEGGVMEFISYNGNDFTKGSTEITKDDELFIDDLITYDLEDLSKLAKDLISKCEITIKNSTEIIHKTCIENTEIRMIKTLYENYNNTEQNFTDYIVRLGDAVYTIKNNSLDKITNIIKSL